MSALQSLIVLSTESRPDSLCRGGGHTCGACCWGEAVSRPVLAERLRRQTLWFKRLIPPGAPPSRPRLLVFELIARRGVDLLVAPLLWVPWLGEWLRLRLHRTMSCAFLAHTDANQEQIGCLLHPTHWHGVDRRFAAFALLAGMGCGRPDFFCLAAWRFAHASPGERFEFRKKVTDADWHGYSRAAARFTSRCTTNAAPSE
jgi:hypothetical protein